MTHQPTQLLSRVGLGTVGVCVISLQLDFVLHSSLIPDSLVGFSPPYDSTVELSWVMCHYTCTCLVYGEGGLNTCNCKYHSILFLWVLGCTNN